MKRGLTHSEFEELLRQQNTLFKKGKFKVVSVFTRAKDPIIVEDKYGLYKCTPYNLLRNTNPCLQNSVDRQANFIARASEHHHNKYDYSLVTYTDNKTPIKIICPIHGMFEQGPIKHINSTTGCSKCSIKERSISKTYTNLEFIEKCNKKHNYKYDYSKVLYNGATSKIKIICSTHGEFTQKACGHILGIGCPKCGIENTLKEKKIKIDDFLHRANKIHNNKYNYELIDFNIVNYKIDIICPVHGQFNQIIHDHLRGNGCAKCGKISSISKIKNLFGGYFRNFSSWVKMGEESKSFTGFKLYVLKLSNDNESFYKVGKTFVNIKDRTRIIPYKVEIIDVIIHKDGREISKLEFEVFKKFKNKQYKPLISFGGSCECFSEIDEILNYIQTHELYSNKEGTLL